MTPREELNAVTDVLEALYFLTHSFRARANTDHIHGLREAGRILPEKDIRELLPAVHKDVWLIKKHYGCTLSDERALEWLRFMTDAAKGGFVYLPKAEILRWFTKYDEVFDRWQHMPLHGLVMFPTSVQQEPPSTVFFADAALFSDALLIWGHVKEILGDGRDFRTRDPQQHRKLHSYLRTGVTVVYHFLEAYLNGLAYSCVQQHHDAIPIDDHDTLCEWNSAKKRRRFVAFERKLREYPNLYAKYSGKPKPPEDRPDVLLLAGEGKELRDSLTHPSPYADPETRDPAKLRRLVSVSDALLRTLLQAAIDFVSVTEESLHGDPKVTVPWLAEARL